MVNNIRQTDRMGWLPSCSSLADGRYHNLYFISFRPHLLFFFSHQPLLWYWFMTSVNSSFNHAQLSFHAGWCGLCVWVAPLMRDQSAEALTLRGGAGRGALNLCASRKLPPAPTPSLMLRKYTQSRASYRLPGICFKKKEKKGKKASKTKIRVIVKWLIRVCERQHLKQHNAVLLTDISFYWWCLCQINNVCS